MPSDPIRNVEVIWRLLTEKTNTLSSPPKAQGLHRQRPRWQPGWWSHQDGQHLHLPLVQPVSQTPAPFALWRQRWGRASKHVFSFRFPPNILVPKWKQMHHSRWIHSKRTTIIKLMARTCCPVTQESASPLADISSLSLSRCHHKKINHDLLRPFQ